MQYKNNKQKKLIVFTERNDITPNHGMGWMKNIGKTIESLQKARNNQSGKNRIIEHFPDLFLDNTTVEDTETNIQLKFGHCP